MRAVILAAGYGTRLERDLKEDTTDCYSHLKGVPKPLLPIGRKPLISHWIEIFEGIPEITSIIVVVNSLHKNRFDKWAESFERRITIVEDGSHCNEERSGAISCMQIGVEKCTEDVLFVAGDTLLKEDFSLHSMISKFNSLEKLHKECSLIVSAPVLEENVSKHGIIEVDEDWRVTAFIEKPLPTETASRLQSPCVYMMSGSSIHHIQNFLKEREDQPLHTRDATGLFVTELIRRVPVYAYHVKGRYDVGGLQSYVQCHQDFLN
ncbi:UTP--glucose-1-phosphate uridylyltransferase-like [Palaemon carinicauda]|uniref:UTP--glucose-1-phosphate uridylyltransferase-like n=1 Tax=Palaemon carinicauda TaxID=392227 RepID=UPI0035B6639D